MKTEAERTRRLFLALWPDDAIRQELKSVQRQCVTMGRVRHAVRVPAANLHITLHFIGGVSHETLRLLRASLSRVHSDPFSLTLDCFGLFRKPGIVWFGPSHTPVEMQDLVAKTHNCLQTCVHLQKENRYQPHVTLFRKAGQPCGIEVIRPLEWHVDRFALVESVTHPQGAQYTVLGQWRLAGKQVD